MRMDSENNSFSKHSRERNRVFKTELPEENQYSSVRVRHKRSNGVNTTMRHIPHRSEILIKNPLRFRETKEKYTKEIQNMPTENNTISFIVSENRSMSNQNHKSINDILEYKPTRPSIEDEEVRMISYIDSKPIQPYISLLPLKNFLKREQEFTRKGTIGSSGNEGGSKMGKRSILVKF